MPVIIIPLPRPGPGPAPGGCVIVLPGGQHIDSSDPQFAALYLAYKNGAPFEMLCPVYAPF